MNISLRLKLLAVCFFGIFVLLLAPYLSQSFTNAEERSPAEVPLTISFFYSSSCPHCHKQMELMRPLADNNPELKINFMM
ncbi:MAG: hypothetical protein AB7C95_08385 [Synergistaceae bacterium]